MTGNKLNTVKTPRNSGTSQKRYLSGILVTISAVLMAGICYASSPEGAKEGDPIPLLEAHSWGESEEASHEAPGTSDFLQGNQWDRHGLKGAVELITDTLTTESGEFR